MKLALPSESNLPQLPKSGDRPDADIDFKRMLKPILSCLPFIVISTVLCVGGAFLYLLKTPKKYASNAVLEVKQFNPGLLSKDAGNNMVNALEEQHTFEQSLINRTLIVAMGRALKLDEDKRLFPLLDASQPATDAQLAKALGSLVQADLRRGTRLVDLKTTYYDAETAKSMADKMIELFVEQGNSQESGASVLASSSLAKEAERLKAKLALSEKSLQEFKENNTNVSTDGGYNTSLERIKELNTQFSKAKGLRLQLESDIARLELLANAEPASLLKVASISTMPEVQELIKEIDGEESRFIALKEWCGRRHPRYMEAEKKLTFLKNTRDAAAQAAASRVRSSYESAMETENRLLTAITEQEKSSVELGKLIAQLNQLENEARSDRALLESVSQRLKETDVSSRLAVSNFRISEAPIVQPEAISPKKTQVVGLALAAGLLLGCGIAIGLEILKPATPLVEMDAPIPAPEIPVLAELPVAGTDPLSLAMDCAHLRHTPQCAAYRTLRSSLTFMRQDKEPRSIVITAAGSSDETSLCALNLAATYAGEGLRTLIIEMNFKSNELERLLLEDVTGTVRGLTDGLAGGCSISGFCHTTKIQNLFLIPTGQNIPNAAALLAGPNFRELMLLAWNSLDRIILSAPPVLQMPEPLVPLRYAEAVCLVAKSGKTSNTELSEAVKRLKFPGHSPAGLIMSDVVPRIMSGVTSQNSPSFLKESSFAA
jgi:uncharacterized protein involved in exopolysaccharide biosynthesis/Mrp family chromosome partitioning ATPase